jgi:hypothetical protein
LFHLLPVLQEGISPLDASPWRTDLKFTFLLTLVKIFGIHGGAWNMAMLGVKKMARNHLREKNAAWKNYGCEVSEFFTEAFICSGYGAAVSLQFLPHPASDSTSRRQTVCTFIRSRPPTNSALTLAT